MGSAPNASQQKNNEIIKENCRKQLIKRLKLIQTHCVENSTFSIEDMEETLLSIDDFINAKNFNMMDFKKLPSGSNIFSLTREYIDILIYALQHYEKKYDLDEVIMIGNQLNLFLSKQFYLNRLFFTADVIPF